MSIAAQGNYINGSFSLTGSVPITSFNPARNFEPVFTAYENIDDIDAAVAAAHKAFLSWSSLTPHARAHELNKVAAEFKKRETDIARAITLEMGKIYSEALAEAQNLSARISLMAVHGLKRVETEYPQGVPGETRYHALGPVAVIGPYNFPAHLLNAHVIPALITGNTVVVKPSEHCPMTGQLYAECFAAAQLPTGVFNLLQGGPAISKKLITHLDIRGVLFTGSYRTGRAIKEALLDHPHKQLALELGGKNFAVVLKDADLYQALAEIVAGAFLTAGQRCTATSRVLIAKEVADQFINSLTRVTRELMPADPFLDSTIFGPLANRQAFERYQQSMNSLAQFPLEILVPHKISEGGAYVSPSLALVNKRLLQLPGYFDEEFFGPHLSVEIIADIDDAVERVNHSPYGLSNALFSASQKSFDYFYHATHVGVLNFNRSTNGASGQLPFGGVGRSGNQRAAGIDAVRYTTYPVAINTQPFGEISSPKNLMHLLGYEENILNTSMDSLVARHAIESLLERYRFRIEKAFGCNIYLDKTQFDVLEFDKKQLPSLVQESGHHFIIEVNQQKPGEQLESLVNFFQNLAQKNRTELFHAIDFAPHAPKDGHLPQSGQYLNRLYCRNFLPKEKKTAVIDLHRSSGSYLCSTDKDPLVFLDAASQIATIGVGFNAPIYKRSLEQGEFDHCLAANIEVTPETEHFSPLHQQNAQEIQAFSDLLLKQGWHGLKDVSYCSSGAEANEIAFRLCRQFGPGGKRIIAFEGSFHGRTILSLQTTHSPDKRRGFEFKGYEASFVPFPANLTPLDEAEASNEWISSWTEGNAPKIPTADELLTREIEALEKVREEIKKGDICCVIIEPMQSEGGDNYGTARFYNGLRALTRGLGVPLVFDEVQTGFCLGGPFYWHSLFKLRNAANQVDGPDCITLAKKAQLGAVVSAWPNSTKSAPNIIQIARGRRQAEEMLRHNPQKLDHSVRQHLAELQKQFPQLVSSPRVQGYAFAFDMPRKDLALGVIEQRFYRGFMSYIAGERTIRFRLNLACQADELNYLFEGIKASLQHIESFLKDNSNAKYSPPVWINTPSRGRKTKQRPEKFPEDFSIEALNLTKFDSYSDAIKRLEEQAFEPGRRDDIEEMRNWLQKDFCLALGLFLNDQNSKILCGYAFGGPLEEFSTDGPLQDPMNGKLNTFYSSNIVLDKKLHGQGLGYLLKKTQIDSVSQMKKSDGSLRFSFMSGRNRIGFASAMTQLVNSFGAYPVSTHDHQYGDPKGKALYYRISLSKPTLSFTSPKENALDWSAGIQAPFGYAPQTISEEIRAGNFTSAVLSKLTLSNFVTPDLVRYMELIHHITPNGLKHSYTGSGQDEILDKAIRSTRVHRPSGEIVIGLTHQYCGVNTAAARSLTDPTGREFNFRYFDWPLIPHPSIVGQEKAQQKLEQTISQHNANRILAIVVELFGEQSGLTISQEFLEYLETIRANHNIPLIFIETASSFGRNGRNFFATENLSVKPNILVWYPGGQLGHAFADDNYYVEKPLTLISTWDGDEISMRRTYQHILLAYKQLNNSNADYFENLLKSQIENNMMSGNGLWQALQFKDQKTRDTIFTKCLNHKLLLKKGLPSTLILCPPINADKSFLEQGVEILKTVCKETIDHAL